MKLLGARIGEKGRGIRNSEEAWPTLSMREKNEWYADGYPFPIMRLK